MRQANQQIRGQRGRRKQLAPDGGVQAQVMHAVRVAAPVTVEAAAQRDGMRGKVACNEPGERTA